MPNFWTKAGQFISEAISNKKTQDEDYKYLCKQMNQTESGINSLKSILKSFNTYVEPFCKYLKTINEAIIQIYKDSPLIANIEYLTAKHAFILKDIENLGKITTKLYSKTSEWDTIFEKAKEIKKVREEKRKNFDHYEQKLLKIEGDQNKKKNIDLLVRNQEKYSKALKEYLDISEKSFEVIKNSIKLSWELSNPIIGELFSSEKKLFEKMAYNFVEFENLTEDLNDMMETAFNPENLENNNFSTYDPKRCIRSQTLMKREGGDNFINKHDFVRNTKTFGIAPDDRKIRFLEIKDDFFSYN